MDFTESFYSKPVIDVEAGSVCTLKKGDILCAAKNNEESVELQETERESLG